MTGASVEVEGVSRLYKTGDEEVWAVRDVSLRIAPGEFMAVIGRSGSGKTTLLNLIAGLERPSTGAVRLDGEDITTFSEKKLTELRRRSLGFIFQSFGLLPLLSAQENVELAMRISGAGRRERINRSHEVLAMMGLSRRAGHRPYELSGGEQQRVAIARALANRPALILADEPTGELDSTTARTIFGLLRDIAKAEGITIITSTHDRTVIELAARVEELADGRLLPPERRQLLRYVEGRDPGHFATPVAAAEPVAAEPVSVAVEEPAAPPTPPTPALVFEALERGPEPAAAEDINRWAPPERG
ncbi:MAG: ABC transporter ATP-binding protein [Dehalococcoidia bacterium]